MEGMEGRNGLNHKIVEKELFPHRQVQLRECARKRERKCTFCTNGKNLDLFSALHIFLLSFFVVNVKINFNISLSIFQGVAVEINNCDTLNSAVLFKYSRNRLLTILGINFQLGINHEKKI